MQASDAPIVSRNNRQVTRESVQSDPLLCPECGGDDVARSRTRTVAERFAKVVIRIRAYRCMDCRTRFFGRRRRSLSRAYR